MYKTTFPENEEFDFSMGHFLVIVFSSFCLIYSYKLPDNILTFFLFLSWVPLTIYYQSQIIGCMTLILLYIMISNTKFCTTLCLITGFTDNDIIHKYISISFILVPTYIILLLYFPINPPYLTQFTIIIMYYINITYLFTLIIIGYKEKYRVEANMLILVSIFFLIIVGLLFSIIQLFNIGIIFLLLYNIRKLIQKYIL